MFIEFDGYLVNTKFIMRLYRDKDAVILHCEDYERTEIFETEAEANRRYAELKRMLCIDKG
jgi:hypothetical protein